jgi:predicted phage tail protein
MLLNIINYAVRIIIIILGLLLLSGVLVPRGMGAEQLTMLRVMGAVFILFGIYRLITYHSTRKRYNRRRDDDDE